MHLIIITSNNISQIKVRSIQVTRMQPVDSLRKQEQSYQAEIRKTYPSSDKFITHCSDLLHLRTALNTFQNKQYTAVYAKTNFKPYDILCQIRGSIISLQRLKDIVKDSKVNQQKLPLLLYLDSERKWLITPKNLSYYFFTHPHLSIQGDGSGSTPKLTPNCYIDRHFDSKLFLSTSEIVLENEQLILDRKSYLMYLHSRTNL